MKTLVVVADDFGLAESVNEGCVDAYTTGIVTELSLMLGSPATEHALKLARQQDITHLGIHLLLKHWRDHGDILRREDYLLLLEELPAARLKKLFDDELAEFRRVTGHPPTHITSQYGIISHPKLLPIVAAYAVGHNIPMRLPSQALYQNEPLLDLAQQHYMKQHHVRTTSHLFAHIEGSPEQVQAAFLADLGRVKEGESAELLLHPGYISSKLASLSGLVHERERDTKLALDASFKAAVEAQGFQLTAYDKVV